MSRASPDVAIPDQQAIIHYADGVETLVIETSFVGEGEDFAWIVPLPAVPEVEEAPDGVFAALNATALTVVHTDTNLIPGFIAVAVCFFLLGYERTSEKNKPRVLAYTFLAVLIAGLAAGILLPSLGSARGLQSTSAPADVTLHAQQRIGAFDVAVLSAENGDSLLDWLSTNGYHSPAGIEPVVRDYVSDGWCFVAVKMSLQQGGAQGVTRPLRMRFATDRPVYPMRLTGVTDENLDVVLWVAADRRAQAKTFEVAQCKKYKGDVHFRDSGMRMPFKPAEILKIEHAGLGETIGRAGVLTKLSATLTPTQMRDDVYLSFQPFAFTEEHFRTRENWLAWIANGFLFILAVIVLVTAVGVSRFGSRRAVYGGASVAACVGLVAIVVASQPSKVIAIEETVHPIRLASDALAVHRALGEAMLRCKDFNEVTPQWAQSVVDDALAAMPPEQRRGVAHIRYGRLPLGYTLHRRVDRPITLDSPLLLVTYNEVGGISNAVCVPGRKSKSISVPLKDVLLSEEWQFREPLYDTDPNE